MSNIRFDINKYADTVSSWKPSHIRIFLEKLGTQIDEKYPAYKAGYTSTFLEKAACEIGKINDNGVDL